MSEQNSATCSFSLFKAVKFILISWLISILLIAVLSAVVVFTDAPEAICVPSVRVITFFGAFLSSCLAAKSAESRGWLLGALVGGFNILLLSLLGSAAYGTNAFSLHIIRMILFGIIAGMAGGIVGVNISR